MLKLLKRIFGLSPEQQALKILEANRRGIVDAGGSYKLLNDYLQSHYHNNAVNLSMNSLGLDFELEPGKQVLQLAVLDLLFEAQKEFMNNAVLNSVLKNGRDLSEESASQLLERLQSDEYKESPEYRLAKFMNVVVARMVSYDEAIAGEKDNHTGSDGSSGELLFDQAKRLAGAELISEVLNISGMDCGDQVSLFTRKIRSLESPNLAYWQRVANSRAEQAEEAFSKWDGRDNYETLMKLVKGKS